MSTQCCEVVLIQMTNGEPDATFVNKIGMFLKQQQKVIYNSISKGEPGAKFC